MPFNNFTIPVDHSDYDILEEEQKTMSKNDEVWIKTKQQIWIGRVLLIAYGLKKGLETFENKMDRSTEMKQGSY